MRVLMVSKACVVGAYQRKLEEIAAHDDVELTVAVPPEWRDERGALPLERAHTNGYRLAVEPMAFNGSFHLHYYPRLRRLVAEVRPHILHIDEEPYNLATWHALRLARRCNAKTIFFSWQNLNRSYPFPWNLMEAYALRHADYAICGSREAAEVWRAKGFRRSVAVIPQFGIDPELFAPSPVERAGADVFTIAYAGRFVKEKGVDLLINAAAQMDDPTRRIRLRLLGAGPQQAALRRLAADSNIAERVSFESWIPSAQFPAFLHGVDVLALPSITQRNWKEQFGRVLVEAMACGVPVVGSTCGEIPNVVGEAGLIVPEGDVRALASALERLRRDDSLHAELARRGRRRALEHFTHRRVADETVSVYRSILSQT